MTEGGSIACLIPARGGSKRFPRKNVAPLNGRPLLAYSVETAVGSGLFPAVWVSTEDAEIAGVAEASGARVHTRPEALAGDGSTLVHVTLDFLDWLEQQGSLPDIICLLLPTAVLLRPDDLREGAAALRTGDADAVMGITTYLEPPQWALHEVDGFLRPLFGPDAVKAGVKPSEACVDSGSFYFVRTAALRRERTLYVERLAGFRLPRMRSIDIDHPEQLAVAEAWLRANAAGPGTGSGVAAEGRSHPFLAGERVYLRPLAAEDLDGPYGKWLNDSQVTRFLETGVFPTTHSALKRYLDAVGRSPENVLLAIVDKATDRHIGNIKLGPIHWQHRRADLGILIGEGEFQGRGLGREAVSLLLEYGFQRLNLHKITLGVDAEHAQAVRLYESLGFKTEGTLPQHLFREGKYRDKYVMGILADAYRAGGTARV